VGVIRKPTRVAPALVFLGIDTKQTRHRRAYDATAKHNAH
jgi:hypothetical protein